MYGGRVFACVGCGHVPGAEPLGLVETIPLPGVEGRIDHMAIDTDGGRLFIAAVGNNSLEIVDLAAGKVGPALADCTNRRVWRF